MTDLLTAPVRAGVVGAGVMGAEHVRLLAHEVSGVEVAGVFDLDAARAEATGAPVADDPFALIADVDCVLVASADATHQEFVLAALEAGTPVLCEKPLAPTVDACRTIVAAEVRTGRRLISLGFMRRFDAGYLQLRAGLAHIAPALVVHCVHRNLSFPGGGPTALITSSLVHEIDAVRWLLDEEIESVGVRPPRRSARAGDVHDPIAAVFRTASGVLVDAEVFGNAGYGYEVRCEVVGDGGTLLLDAIPPVVRRADRAVSYGLPADWRDRFRDAYRAELTDWVTSVAGGTVSGAASAWDGYASIAVADAARLALETGTDQPVVLDARPELYS